MNTDTFPPPEIRTDRLLLRKPRPEDAQPIFDTYATDTEVTTYLLWRPHVRVEVTEEFIDGCLNSWQTGSAYPYVIAEIDAPDTPIGMIDLRPDGATVNTGYVLARPHWRKGYIPEALSRLIELSLEQEHIYRFAAYCDAGNIASARVMEKAGMECEGLLHRYAVSPNIEPEPRDCLIYAKVK